MAADTAAIAIPSSVVDAKRRNARDARADGLFRWIVAAAGFFVLLTLTGAALSMLWGGREALSTFGFSFLWSTDWDAVTTSSARSCRSTARSSRR